MLIGVENQVASNGAWTIAWCRQRRPVLAPLPPVPSFRLPLPATGAGSLSFDYVSYDVGAD